MTYILESVELTLRFLTDRTVRTMQQDLVLTADEKRVIEVRLKEHPNANRYDSFHILRRKWERKATQKARGDAVDAGWYVAAGWYKMLPTRMGLRGQPKKLKLPPFNPRFKKPISPTTSGRRPEGVQEGAPSAILPAATPIAKEPSANASTETEAPEPPLPPVPSSSSKSKGQVSLLARVEWVFEHLGAEDIEQEDAPTPGAWKMLQAYKDDPTDFYDTFVKSMLPSKAALELETQRYDRGEVPLQFLERCKAKAQELMSESAASLN